MWNYTCFVYKIYIHSLSSRNRINNKKNERKLRASLQWETFSIPFCVYLMCFNIFRCDDVESFHLIVYTFVDINLYANMLYIQYVYMYMMKSLEKQRLKMKEMIKYVGEYLYI